MPDPPVGPAKPRGECADAARRVPPAASSVVVVVEGMPGAPREAQAAVMALARGARLALTDARRLLEELPVTLPLRLEPTAAKELAAALAAAGAKVEIRAQLAEREPCATHEALVADGACARCGVSACVLCARRSAGGRRCAECLRKDGRRRTFFRARVSVLLVVLGVVLLYAWRDVRQRRARTEWDRTLNVAVVLLRRGPVDDESIAALRRRLPALEEQLAAERRRHGGGSFARPFQLAFFGPIDVAAPPPAPASGGLADLARHALAEWRYLRPVDAAAGLVAKSFDARIYIVASPSRGRVNFVEGTSQQGGRLGFVSVELAPAMADFALFVAAHELFHTLGATDKYDEAGDVLVPEGLAEPELEPLYPQHYTELMARHRALGERSSAPPENLLELRIGRATAREIGW